MSKNLTGYVIADSINQDKDTLKVKSDFIFFNLADAKECNSRYIMEGQILKVIIPYPQNGKN